MSVDHIINLDNVLEIVVYYFLIEGIVGLSHQDKVLH